MYRLGARQKSKQKYRCRVRLERASQEQSSYNLLNTMWQNGDRCRGRKMTTESEPMRVDDVYSLLCRLRAIADHEDDSFGATASAHFTTAFVNNPFGHSWVWPSLSSLRSFKPSKEKNVPRCLVILKTYIIFYFRLKKKYYPLRTPRIRVKHMAVFATQSHPDILFFKSISSNYQTLLLWLHIITTEKYEHLTGGLILKHSWAHFAQLEKSAIDQPILCSWTCVRD